MYGGFYTRQEQEDANASRLEHNPNRVGTGHAGFINFGPQTRSVQPAANWQTSGLIGGGGYGTFVFQGLNQTAGDLILLGALPTVALALFSAIAMDILVELTTPRTEREE
ncbi:hypothetical protein [Thioclava electrotropha]|uniref:hypothetical protein n=1 Tax=Thioclava electrotropha TaxID=1549850 RepID=UPI0023A8E317|nr:hypothetical protein [Thioclava electrotropha]